MKCESTLLVTTALKEFTMNLKPVQNTTSNTTYLNTECDEYTQYALEFLKHLDLDQSAHVYAYYTELRSKALFVYDSFSLYTEFIKSNFNKIPTVTTSSIHINQTELEKFNLNYVKPDRTADYKNKNKIPSNQSSQQERKAKLLAKSKFFK